MVWFAACTLFYGIITMWENNRRQKIIETGVTISKDISSQSGFPLLEKNIKRLSQLVEKITQKPEVIFASIIDHKNKIIAYSDKDQFLTFNRNEPGVIDNVQYWRISNPNDQKVMTFSSEITFSGTRVGEVLISLAADNIGQLKQVYIIFSVFTLLILALLFGVSGYKRYRSDWKWFTEKLYSPESIPADDFSNPEIKCPLCGNHEDFSLSGFQTPDLEKLIVFKHDSGENPEIKLQDITKAEELNWLRRLLITQCTKIINKIAAG